jgi:hypothetical protein
LAVGFPFLRRMDIAKARQHVQVALERMRASYLKPVFDEWAILTLGPKGGDVVAYHGPRAEKFKHNVAEDAEPLRARTSGRTFTEGDIEFATDAPDTRYDAFIKVGPTSYLVLNNTTKTMADIRADAKWLSAQPALFELSERFRSDPLQG